MPTETLTTLSFFVRGIPEAKGSHNAFIQPADRPDRPNPRCALCGKPRYQRVVVTDEKGKRLEDWEMAIRTTAHEAHGPGWQMWEGAVSVSAKFYFPRLKSHPKLNPPTWKISKPDTDKLMRAVLDALTGVVYVDDSRVVDQRGQKYYADVVKGVSERYGVEITVELLGAAA